MAPPYVCLVTVHGIGFQQPPKTKPPTPGYADELHNSLKEELVGRLGDDPNRPGPVYVQSEWKGSRNAGLARLDPTEKLLDKGEIAHVALVYSPSEEIGPQLGSTLDATARAALSFNHYTGVMGALGVLGRTIWGVVTESDATPGMPSNLRPRTDLPREHHLGHLARLAHALRGNEDGDGDGAPHSTTILRAIEDDIAAYVCRNDLRERVRGFVQQALQRLLDREDVGAVVINAHSQGSVLCWDVLCRLPLFSWADDPGGGLTAKIRGLVTAGSPIRKYVDLFTWGDRVGQMAALSKDAFAWHNYWDDHDPVADPLDPPASWRPGQPTDVERDPEDHSLLVAIDPGSGARRHFVITDTKVDNVHHSAGGGLQAHDYWNNREDFVAPLAGVLGAAAAP
jgi:hypothetical protein